jgi:hypothetical protein
MKNICFIFVYFLLVSHSFSQGNRKANQDTQNWRYEVEGVGVGKEGTYLVRVWSYSKKPDIAIEQAKKNAVHAIIFQGFIGLNRVGSQPPICNEPGAEKKHEDFFKSFFADNGYYMKYVFLSSDGAVSEADRQKIGKEFKIGVIVSVRKDLLIKDLVSAGIVKSLSSGF